ncbi:hypothetical protein LJK88_19790 [Paenibacillus sp. P26]|nr:hypothetical protein LJK88_19790 [Paenibacillus sp. P26]
MTKKVKLRSIVIGGVFTLLFVILVGRLYWVQVVNGAELLTKAEKLWADNKKSRLSGVRYWMRRAMCWPKTRRRLR